MFPKLALVVGAALLARVEADVEPPPQGETTDFLELLEEQGAVGE